MAYEQHIFLLMPLLGGLDHSQGKWFAPGEALPPGFIVTSHPEGHTAPQEGHLMTDKAWETAVVSEKVSVFLVRHLSLSQARESFVVTTGTKLGSSAPTKVPKARSSFQLRLGKWQKRMQDTQSICRCHGKEAMHSFHHFVQNVPWSIPLYFIPSRNRRARRRSPVDAAEPVWARAGAGASTVSTRPILFTSETWYENSVTVLRRLFSVKICADFGGLRFQVSWVSCQEISFWSTELQDGVAKMFGWRSGPCEDYWTPRRGRIIQWHCPWLSGEGHTHLVSCTLPSPTARDWHLPPFCHLFAKLNDSCRLTANFQFQDPAAELLLIELELYGVEGHLRFLLVKRANIDSKRRHLRHTTFHAPFLPFYDSCIAPCHWRLDPISLEQQRLPRRKVTMHILVTWKDDHGIRILIFFGSCDIVLACIANSTGRFKMIKFVSSQNHGLGCTGHRLQCPKHWAWIMTF